MSRLAKQLEAFVALSRAGRTLEAIERYYAEDVVVFENRELARAGREKCLDYERSALAGLAEPPRFELRGAGVDEAREKTFVEWVLHFVTREGKAFRLEEVAVQKWHGDRISEERFYYEGVVDQNDEP